MKKISITPDEFDEIVAEAIMTEVKKSGKEQINEIAPLIGLAAKTLGKGLLKGVGNGMLGNIISKSASLGGKIGSGLNKFMSNPAVKKAGQTFMNSLTGNGNEGQEEENDADSENLETDTGSTEAQANVVLNTGQETTSPVSGDVNVKNSVFEGHERKRISYTLTESELRAGLKAELTELFEKGI